MGTRLGVSVLVALALVCSSVSRASADDEKDKKRKKILAGRLLKAGDRAMRAGDYQARRKRPDRAKKAYERALKAYEKAFELYPFAQIYFPIGLAEQKLGRYIDAIRHYRQLLDEVADMKPALRKEVDKRFAEVKKHVVVLTLKVKPDGASINVDGEEVGTSPMATAVFLKPGEHTIAVTRDKYIPHEKKEPFTAGDVQKEITLEKIPVVVKKVKKKKKTKKTPAGPSKQRLYIGVGTTAGMATFALIFGLAALNKHGLATDMTINQQGRENAASSGKTYAVLSDLFWLGTIAAGAYTAYYYYKVYKPNQSRMERQSSRARQWWVAPFVGSNQGGVAAGGRF